jgi:DNA-binding phage protein
MKLKEFDIAEHLNSEEEIQMYIDDILDSNDVSLIRSAQNDIDKARFIILTKNINKIVKSDS